MEPERPDYTEFNSENADRKTPKRTRATPSSSSIPSIPTKVKWEGALSYRNDIPGGYQDPSETFVPYTGNVSKRKPNNETIPNGTYRFTNDYGQSNSDAWRSEGYNKNIPYSEGSQGYDKKSTYEFQKQFKSMQAVMRNMHIENKLKNANGKGKYAVVNPANIAYHEVISSHPAVTGTRISGLVTKLENKLDRKQKDISTNEDKYVAIYTFKKSVPVKNSKTGKVSTTKPKWDMKIVTRVMAGLERNKNGEYLGIYQKNKAYQSYPVSSLPANERPGRPIKGVKDANRQRYMQNINIKAKAIGAPIVKQYENRNYSVAGNTIFIDQEAEELVYLFGDYETTYGKSNISPPQGLLRIIASTA